MRQIKTLFNDGVRIEPDNTLDKSSPLVAIATACRKNDALRPEKFGGTRFMREQGVPQWIRMNFK